MDLANCDGIETSLRLKMPIHRIFILRSFNVRLVFRRIKINVIRSPTSIGDFLKLIMFVL